MKINISVLTETKKEGEGNGMSGNYKKFYSGVPKSSRENRGVSILIYNSLVKYIKSWQQVNKQIITFEIQKRLQLHYKGASRSRMWLRLPVDYHKVLN